MQSPLARWFQAQLQPKRQGRATGVGGSLGVPEPLRGGGVLPGDVNALLGICWGQIGKEAVCSRAP